MTPVHILTKDSAGSELKLPAFQHLARQVFDPDVPETDYDNQPTTAPQLQLDNWRDQLNKDHSAIFYVTFDALAPPLSAVSETTAKSPSAHTPIAFFLAYPRPLQTSKLNSPLSYHIFLAAVHPSARGRGLFPALLEATKIHARNAKFQILTVSTIPNRFPRMWSLLGKEGSGWEVVEWKEGEGGRKVVMKTQL